MRGARASLRASAPRPSWRTAAPRLQAAAGPPSRTSASRASSTFRLPCIPPADGTHRLARPEQSRARTIHLAVQSLHAQCCLEHPPTLYIDMCGLRRFVRSSSSTLLCLGNIVSLLMCAFCGVQRAPPA